jgi:hypothetical protein
MKNFLTDLWHDLRDKRLWPVAVALLAGLVAVPVVLSKSAEEPPAAAPEATEARTAPEPRELKGLATVKLDETATGTGSTLDTFDPSNPFRPPRAVLKESEESSSETASEAGPGSAQPEDKGSTGSTGGGDTGATGDTGGGTITPGTGDTGDTGDTHEPADATPVTDYSYTADVQFGEVNNLRRYATVQRLGLIPSRKLPLIMYLGVSTDHETAVFMVDSRLSQGGEGTCVPKDTLCTFLELKPTPSQDEHHFMDADGNEYLLRLRALNRTTASSGTLSGRSVSALQDSPLVVDGER